MCDRIITGVQNSELRDKLLQTTELTLEKCISICELSEFHGAQVTASQNSTQVDSIRSGRGTWTARAASLPWTQRTGTQSTNRPNAPCGYCGSSHRRGQCPANGKTCMLCKKVGHFAKVCRSRPPTDRRVSDIAHGDETEDTGQATAAAETDTVDWEMFIGELNSERRRGDGVLWYKDIQVGHHKVHFKMDTGSEANIIPRELFNRLDGTTLMKHRINLVTYSGERIRPDGEAIITIQGQQLLFQVVPNGHPIIGKEACVALGLIIRVDDIEQVMGECTENKATTADNLVSEYPDVFSGLGLIKSNAHIHVCDQIEPCIDPPRRIPYAIQAKVRAEIDRMLALGVIVEQNEPTPWVNSITIVKKTNKLRICLDPTKLNKAIKRGPYPTKTVEEVLAKTSQAKFFSVIDAKTGYWQIMLDHDSSNLCTFNTPWGRYRFTRLPFGIKTAGDIFIKEMNRLMGDIEGVDVITDDILVYGRTVEEHNTRLKKVLDRARSSNLKLNPEKSKICRQQVRYVGHVITSEGVKPDPDRVQAIIDMPDPTDKQGVQRFMGMIGYVQKFIPNLSEIAKPIRILLSKNTAWHWDTEQINAYNKLKLLLKTAPVLAYYNVNKTIVLQVDACQSGLGAAILQDQRPVAMASRALDSVQSGYAVIEKELLAICFGCVRFHDYIFGKSIIVQSDHKPLISIMSKPLHTLSARMQRMRMRLQNYDISVQYVKGVNLLFADTLSRAHSRNCTPSALFDDEMSVTTVNMSNDIVDRIVQETKIDNVLLELRKTVTSGWLPRRKDTPHILQQFYTHKDNITIENGLLLKDNKIIVPASMQRELLNKIHETHLGYVKSKQLARDNIFWPGMDTQLNNIIDRCTKCHEHRSKPHAEPLISHDIPDIPYYKVATDLFEIENRTYIVIVDYYTKYPEITQLKNTNSESIINALKEQFCRHGIPRYVVSDNGPQFSSREYHAFAIEFNFTPVYTSPYHPKSNGQVERYVRTIKSMINKSCEENQDIQLALLNYRNTTIPHLQASPAQLLMSRNLRSKIPTRNTNLKPQVQNSKQECIKAEQQRQKYYHDKRVGKEHKKIQIGDNVRYRTHKNTWAEGQVIKQSKRTEREYTIRNNKNHEMHRNRTLMFRTPTKDKSQSPNRVITTQRTPSTESKQYTTRYGRLARPVERFGYTSK